VRCPGAVPGPSGTAPRSQGSVPRGLRSRGPGGRFRTLRGRFRCPLDLSQFLGGRRGRAPRPSDRFVPCVSRAGSEIPGAGSEVQLAGFGVLGGLFRSSRRRFWGPLAFGFRDTLRGRRGRLWTGPGGQTGPEGTSPEVPWAGSSGSVLKSPESVLALWMLEAGSGTLGAGSEVLWSGSVRSLGHQGPPDTSWTCVGILGRGREQTRPQNGPRAKQTGALMKQTGPRMKQTRALMKQTGPRMKQTGALMKQTGPRSEADGPRLLHPGAPTRKTQGFLLFLGSQSADFVIRLLKTATFERFERYTLFWRSDLSKRFAREVC